MNKVWNSQNINKQTLASSLFQYILDHYWLDRNPTGPIIVRYRVKKVLAGNKKKKKTLTTDLLTETIGRPN